ncbi:hypothetical protein ACF0H5_006704 [Mactra antiquata]
MEQFIPESPPQVVDGITLKFPAKLWRIVNNCCTGAISWECDGESIKVDRKKFEEEFLKTGVFFKTSNFQSFIRQLNIYGFRKLPTNGPKSQQDGCVFTYKHDFFKRDYPEFLSEVIRNTAVRKTQRENAFREIEEMHGKLEDEPILPIPGTKQTQKKVDESHPLLKFPAKPVFKYGVPAEKSKITTVYLNPRVTVCDMQRMSPTKLHHQVTDLLTAIADDDDTPPYKRQRQSKSLTICRPFKDKSPKEPEVETESKPAILFVPNPCSTKKSDIKQADIEHSRTRRTRLPSLHDTNSSKLDLMIGHHDLKGITTDSLSQESLDSQHSLMFGCPIDGDDDDLDSAFIQNLHPTLGNDVIESSPETLISGSIDKSFDLDCNDIDVFDNEVFDTNDSVSYLDEEQGYLTPAYYDPDTGTVTLLLPTMSPEF